ncbi:imidazolonepropionase, partial [bacterium]|nr:imidazolonepropionase [bacterium]
NKQLIESGPVDHIVTGIGQLCTMESEGEITFGPRRNELLSEVGIINDAAFAIKDGKIAAVAPSEELEKLVTFGPETTGEDIDQRLVLPGFVDPHTHTVFGKTRQDEYDRRIKGETYLEIAASGGGIHSSVSDMRSCSDEKLLDLTCNRLADMLEAGTTTVEIKSGYGLSLEDELRMLKVASEAGDKVNIGTVLTCLAAHEVPTEFKDNRDDYIDLICQKVLPEVTKQSLAHRLDVFCEPTVFTLDETEKIIKCGMELGLRATVHADELASYGAAKLAVTLGADSADHLIQIDSAGINALANSKTVAVLLPGTVFSLGIDKWAPAREMIEKGVAVALATDFNPGSSPIRSMQIIMSIACTQMKMTPAEALVASTINSASALGISDRVGSIAPGKQADYMILDYDDYRLIPYHMGHNNVVAVFRNGEQVVG